MKSPTRDDRIMYDVYCATSNSEPVDFAEWFLNKEEYDADFKERLKNNDIPGFKDSEKRKGVEG